ncbi:DUF3102 domain-containing protein [Streptococcus dysgalactiae subsp. dysgalactiae]|nr:DUF3102 domain-containing protein [Streptococcus dysgalactiae subsp. dysgalactiae]
MELEINHHKNIVGQSIWEIGRRLNHVKENDLAHGEFTEWAENKIGINRREAYKFMKVASEIPNSSTYSNLGYNALYLIASLPDDQKTSSIGESQRSIIKQISNTTTCSYFNNKSLVI